ncbi:acyltransferase family protein [Rufibacter latericius]|uniref:DUF1624 domain-containing protein n=1 Tax=Rufibacter latericius TaxID=2487040 RepID=A0A3M9MKN8_9BACT|nr:heparan-alpha-glucosaminide N-acetyltransferase domain-containing protein [Rufibacter latericius]RNI26041.1 DUF1624 domain-containing protein [Rufibacter latericius]
MKTTHRLLSLDFMRGIIMILLAAESTLLYVRLQEVAGERMIAGSLVQQFFHVPWRGLHFWDLVQPAFMTIAGTSLYFSTQNRLQKGDAPSDITGHVLKRSLKLLLCGVALHCVYAGKLVWELWNVLSQLSVTLLIAYFLLRFKAGTQLAVSFLCIGLTEVLYRYSQIPGFDQPFTPAHNFGSWMDLQLMGKLNSDHWIAMNFLPSAAHTIWGALVGKELASQKTPFHKIKVFLLAGLIGIVVGHVLDVTGVDPMIKRTCTASFVLASGGWVMWLLAFCYWGIDVKKAGPWVLYFTVVGMNPIFIYLFFETVGMQWLNGAVSIFTNGASSWFQLTGPVQAVLASLVTLAIEWYLCYWLYQKRIFFRL